MMLVLLLALVFIPRVVAADAGAIAAALKDEAPECRYVGRMCDELREQMPDKKISVSQKLEKLSELSKAMTVVRAKHEQMPACFQQCDGLMNLEKFKEGARKRGGLARNDQEEKGI